VGAGVGVDAGVGLGVGVGAGGGVGVGVGGGGALGPTDGLGIGVATGLAGGQGSAATPEPAGVGATNDGIKPLASGVGTGKHVGDALGAPQVPPTRGPHDEPNGWKAPL
jgi:hypothetical protein